MTTSEKTGTSEKRNVYQRVLDLMAEVEPIEKTRDGAHKQKTYSHDDVSDMLRPLLVKHGLLILPSQDKERTVIEPGNRSVVLYTDFIFINVDDPSDQFTVSSIQGGTLRDDTGYGAAFSYACKYMHAKALFISGASGVKDLDDKSYAKAYDEEHKPIRRPQAKQSSPLPDEPPWEY